jgi:hypothetical protein
VLLLFLYIAQLLRCGEGVRYFLKSSQRSLRILKIGLIEDGLGGAARRPWIESELQALL